MTPYTSFHFFVIALIVLLPVIILGLFGKRSKVYNFISTAIMIVIIFADKKHNLFGISYISYPLISFIAYILWQTLIIKVYERMTSQNRSTSYYVLALVLSIAPLFMVKLLQSSWLGKGQLHMHSSKLVELFAFLGISYITFKSVQLIMEIHDRTLKEKVDVKKLIQFISFFPTISSGPIDRYRRFKKDDDKELTKERYRQLLGKAIHFIMLGFLYKYIIAYVIQNYGVKPYTGHLETFGDYWFYMYTYSFYLFFDFAGYSLFAIALSYIYGIETPMNFNQPFRAKNIKDFWNRWHMTLSFWFRDCIYMRFVFFMAKKKYIKSTFHVSNIAFLLNFGIMGLWHGFEWFYVAYGLYHALLFFLYNYYEKWRKKRFGKWNHPVINILSIVITFHFVAFGFLIFSGQLI
ncbi:D-alanyl-lipoteichoic acid biosynthesis protein DltB [Staphylococcus coagulans]|uniref:D-alanyl-lipoteichoic acid biosynthesis protein DltB n=1 Tax=Staphylococcus coagulans TaxID=74706 RepID=UPI0015FD48BF|nr:D-alanyl-lipoteichoic acid biosynthesis protein DltB [Staphylococcus coagulans]MBA8759412.1 D-alanyl-lipoteichoic acid biosynthesis protein DltB [Staphylococcus coagulans]MBA8761233.1 D-alanyl-lipoteichoic acid biosynthesis protein DltB [Staphylococcus coagulans]MBA8767808.1 D-alanyl-lipoteichoic acid biosynthesis protein DltB [Staphylococcus coagulans]